MAHDRVHRFALVYASQVGPSLFEHGAFAPCSITSVESCAQEDGAYISIITQSHKSAKDKLLASIVQYNVTQQLDSPQTGTVALLRYEEYRGVLAGISEHRQLPEGEAFAECKRRVAKSRGSAAWSHIKPCAKAFVVSPISSKKKTRQRRAAVFILCHKPLEGLECVLLNGLKMLQIKAFATVPDPADAAFSLTRVAMRMKRPREVVLACIADYNEWHHPRLELAPGCGLMSVHSVQPRSFLACKRLFGPNQ
jgi:hypothetical protein